jgi:polysaccharide export outer membrane protein
MPKFIKIHFFDVLKNLPHMPGTNYWPSAISSRILGVLLIFLIVFSSCNTSKRMIYFQDIPNDTTLTNLVSKDFDAKIRKNDLLGITVSSMSPDNAFYNAPQNGIGPLAGYQVDEAGNIRFVKLGVLHVEGLTKKELKAVLEKDLIPYLKDAVVSIGFLNRHITMMGAVASQVLPMPAGNMTILDALASSGDIGDKGRIDNVLVIRDTAENAKEFKRLDLRDNSIFYSPYFYLQPDDIVYVEPTKIKVNKTTQLISYVTAGITFLIFIFDRIIK